MHLYVICRQLVSVVTKFVHKIQPPLFAGKPDKCTVSWCDDDTHTGRKSEHIQIIPDQGVPLLIKPGKKIIECNFGPDNNQWGKRNWQKKNASKRNVDHSQGLGSSRCPTYDGRRLGCPAKIEMKEVFVILGYNVSTLHMLLSVTSCKY